MQLKRGARETLDHLYSDLEYILQNSHDPIAVEKLARRIRERIQEEIEPRLQRAAPTVEQRIETLEQQVADLLTARTDPKIVAFRKDGTG